MQNKMKMMKQMAGKAANKITKQGLQQLNLNIEIKFVKLTVKSDNEQEDTNYVIDWKRGPDTFTTNVYEIKNGT